METYTPFCGTPPVPADLLSRWTFDPWLLIGLAVAFAILWRGSSGPSRRQSLAGWTVVAVLFVSPLCALSMALFSARVAQHLLLSLVAAPLLAAALKDWRPPPMASPVACAAVFATLFWVWHMPGAYAATLQSDLAYWAMHLSLLGAAVLLWAALRGAVRTQPFASVLGLAFTAAQMTGLSVLLVVSDRLWHPWHVLTTAPYGLSASHDQVLAGALMWVAGGIVVTGAVAALAFTLVHGEGRQRPLSFWPQSPDAPN